MPYKPDDTNDVFDIISKARGEPPRITPETEMPMLLGLPDTGKDKLIASKLDELKPGRSVRLVSQVKVFVLWRPWTECARCASDIENGLVQIPQTGDYTCPHTQLTEFKTVKDKALSGDYLKEREEHFQLNDGTRCVEFAWLEIDPLFTEELKNKAKADKVYPPNPEKVFNQPLENKPKK